jgi:hypothetical protein
MGAAGSSALAPDASSPDASPPDVLPPVDATVSAPMDERPEFGETDVVFHVVNDTGADVFIDDDRPLMLELQGKPLALYAGCGADCPSCACKECPVEPPQVRRIPDRGTWDDGWRRRVYVAQRCGGACPCIREVAARAGTYTVSLQGKRKATTLPAGHPSVFAGRLDEQSVDCKATATFELRPGAQVTLKLTCER